MSVHRIKSWIFENWLLLGGIALAIAVRVELVPVLAGEDLPRFFLPYYRHIVATGRLHSVGLEISDYAPAYMYLLALVSWLPLDPIAAVKAIPITFDLLTAVVVWLLVRVYHDKGPTKTVAVCAFLLSPTVLVNGALWGQCDIIHTSFVLCALLCALVDRPLAAVSFLSVAAAVKMQALFFVPALGLLFILRGLSLAYFAALPLAYVVLAIPAVVAGRSWASVLMIYPRQMSVSTNLTANAASIYTWLPQTPNVPAQTQAGIAFAAGACALSGYVLSRQSTRQPTRKHLLGVALFMSALPPFLLPGMHERYAFVSDVLASFVPFVLPSLAVPCLLLIGASLASYGPFLGCAWLPLPDAAVLNLTALVMIARKLAAELGIGSRFDQPG